MKEQTSRKGYDMQNNGKENRQKAGRYTEQCRREQTKGRTKNRREVKRTRGKVADKHVRSEENRQQEEDMQNRSKDKSKK